MKDLDVVGKDRKGKLVVAQICGGRDIATDSKKMERLSTYEEASTKIYFGKQRPPVARARGDNIEEYAVHDVVRRLTTSKGNLFWDYIGGSYSKAETNLHVFDGVIVADYITDAHSGIKGTRERIREANEDMVQAIGRVTRPDPEGRTRRKTIAVFDSRAFEYLKCVFKTSEFMEVNSLTADLFTSHNEPYRSQKERLVDVKFDIQTYTNKGRKYKKYYWAVPTEEAARFTKPLTGRVDPETGQFVI